MTTETATQPPQTGPPGIRVDADMVLTLDQAGDLIVVHRKLVDPVQVDMVQLRNWLRRQLRETV